MAIKEPEAPAVGDKGLQAGALGLVGNIVIGLAAVAPAYSLAATLGYVVLAVGEKAPSMFLLAFIPMLLVAFAYKELSQDTPDCGTTFTWGTKAFGPWIGWIGGWGLAVSAIIVLANVAEVAAIYMFKFLGLDDLAENIVAKVLLGSFFIIAMTLISARGIVVSERFQNVLIAIQFGVLIIVSIIALVRVFSGTAGAQAIMPKLSWLWPSGLDVSSIAAAIILCIFIYWGWDACWPSARRRRTPGAPRHRRRDHHADPGVHLCAGGVCGAVVLRIQRGGDRTEQPDEHRRRAHRARQAGRRHDRGVPAVAHGLGLGAVIDADDDPADCARHAVDGRVRGHSQTVRQCPSALHDPGVRHHRDGAVGAVLLPTADVPVRERTRRFGGVAGIGGGVLLRHHRVRVRLVLPQDIVLVGAEPVLPRHLPTDRRAGDGGGIRHQRQGHDRTGLRLHRVGPVGGVFVLGVGMLVLGIPLMLACFAFGTKRFFRGETLTAATEVKVPEPSKRAGQQCI